MMDRSFADLDSRAAKVLKAVVESYIENTEPVGARTLSRKYDFNLCPASIRNVMADLEDIGYLLQPHLSAGRVPSDMGYRYYVESLVNPVQLVMYEMKNIQMATYGADWLALADLLSSISRSLADLSKQAGLVGVTSWGGAPVRMIRFVYIDDGQVMAVIAAMGGEIRSQLIKTAEPLNQEILDEVSNYLNHRFCGKTLIQMRAALLKELEDEKNNVDGLMGRAFYMARLVEEKISLEVKDAIYVDGASNLIENEGRTTNLSKIKALFKTFDEKTRLLALLGECLKSDGISLVIGGESEMDEFSDFSVVAHSFDGQDGALGAVGIIGPKRMNYSRAMALVSYAAGQITRRLNGQEMEELKN